MSPGGLGDGTLGAGTLGDPLAPPPPPPPPPPPYIPTPLPQRTLCDWARTALEDLPPVLRQSASYQAILNAYGREVELAEARIEGIRAEFFPQTADELLKVWESELGLPPEPSGKTLTDRRQVVLTHISKLSGEPEGAAWEQKVTDLIGPGWSYEEHQAGVGTSPAAGVLRIAVPFPSDAERFAGIERLLRDITPAHLDIQILSSTGFLLDSSALDEEVLRY